MAKFRYHLRSGHKSSFLSFLLLVFAASGFIIPAMPPNLTLQSESVFAQIEERQSITVDMANTTTTATTGNRTYENPEWGISLQYPSNWTASTSGLRDYTELIAFYSPLQNLSHPFAARLAISGVQFTQNLSLQEYTNFALEGLNQSELDMKNSSEVTVAGYPGYRLVLADMPFQNNTLTLYIMNMWTTVGNKVYVLTYEGEQLTFNQHLPEVSLMLESLRIENNNSI